MVLKDILSEERFGNVALTSKNNMAILKEIAEEMDKPEELNPQSFYNKWTRGEYSIIETLSKSLVKDYPIERIYGNKTETIFLSSLGSFTVTDYIKKKYNVTINFTSSQLLDYNIYLYQDLTLITTAMLLNKYRPESLFREHIIFIGIKVLFTYFTLYKNDVFLVNLMDYKTAVVQMLEADMKAFDEIAIKLGFKHSFKQETRTPSKTLTREQI